MIQKNASVLIIAAMVALAVFSASAAAAETMNISVTEPNQYFSTPQNISVPKNATKLIISADTTDIQIDIHLYDPFGNHTGALYPIGEETEIPNSTYSGWDTDPEVITVTNPAAGNYTLKAYGYYVTGWANCTITIITKAPTVGNASYIIGQVFDQSLKPLEGVNVSVKDNKTLELLGYDYTDSNGNFNVTILPPSYPVTVDIHFEKECYGARDELGLVVPHPGWVSEPIYRYMTEKEKTGLIVNATPKQINVSETTTIKIEVRENVAGLPPVEGANVTLTGAGITPIHKTTPANGTIYVDVTPTSTGIITVTATKTCHYDGTDTIKVIRPIRREKVGNLTVFVYDYVTGDLIGTGKAANRSYTYNGEVHTCDVPQVYVEVKDATTGEIVGSNMTVNGTAEITIPLNDSVRKVNVYANANKTLVWYMADATTPPWYVHWILPATPEMGVDVIEGWKTVTMYVGVKNPEPQILKVNATPSTINVSETTTVKVSVTGMIEGYPETERPIPNATVRLVGAGVNKTVITPANGIIYVDVTPTSTGTITVTATKKCYVSGSDEIEVIRKIISPQLVLIVKPVDAQNKDKRLSGATVEVYDVHNNLIRTVTDEGAGDVASGDPGNISISSDLIPIPASDIWIKVRYPGYNYYLEHGIDLVPPGIPKEVTVEMTRP